MKNLALFFVPFLLAQFLITPQIIQSAENPNDSRQTRERFERAEQRIEQRNNQRKERVASRTAKAKERLDEAKQRICAQKENQITRRSERIANRAERQVNVFTSIAQRVDNYYLNKLVPQGITIDDYGQLKANIEGQKEELNEAVKSAKEAAGKFGCQGEDPKGELANFREEMKAVVEALKDFRASIKDFIQAIRTAKAEQTATDSAQ